MFGITLRQALLGSRTWRVRNGFANASFALVGGQTGIAQASVPTTLLWRFDVDVLYLA